MGGHEIVQSKLGEVVNAPPFEIVAAGSTAAFGCFGVGCSNFKIGRSKTSA